MPSISQKTPYLAFPTKVRLKVSDNFFIVMPNFCTEIEVLSLVLSASWDVVKMQNKT